MHSKMGFAILAVAIDAPGIHANAWVKAARKSPYVELRGVWDHKTTRGQKVAKRYNTQFVGTLDEVLSDPNIHIVGICSENNRHAELAVQSAKAKKHILCEKPMALSVKDCNRVIEAIQQNGVKYMPCFPKRYCVIHQKTRNLVKEGVLGRISSVRMRHGHYLGFIDSYRNDWYADPSQSGGGVIVDQAIHAIDYLRWVFGEPKSVFAEKNTMIKGLPVEDNVVALFQFPGNLIAILQSSWTYQVGLNTIEIFGDKGTLIQYYGDLASIRQLPEVAPKPLLVWTKDTTKSQGHWTNYDLPIYHKKSHEMLAAAFFEAIAKGEEPAVTALDGKRAVEIMLALEKSADTKKIQVAIE